MSEIKLVVTDIDGTLVEAQSHVPSPSVRRAMQAVQEAGVTVAAATARPFEMAQELFADMGFRGPSIFDGGASIYDVETGELLWQNWLSTERLRTIANIVLPHATQVDFFPGYKIVDAQDVIAENLTEPAPYAYAFVRTPAVPGIQQKLKALGNVTVHVLLGKEDPERLIELQITDVNSDKFHAIQALRGILHVTKEDTLGIGDSSNDIPLLQNAGLKIAMGNAIPEILAIADHVVGTVDQDGWREAMDRFVLA
jgi:HAD superfamily hydrolase (TIGR01484 family)